MRLGGSIPLRPACEQQNTDMEIDLPKIKSELLNSATQEAAIWTARGLETSVGEVLLSRLAQVAAFCEIGLSVNQDSISHKLALELCNGK